MLIDAKGWRLLGVAAHGVLHVGAHEGEEGPFYHRRGWGPVIWVEMLPDKAAELRAGLRDGDQVIEAACWDADGEVITLNRASNAESSSLLPPLDHLAEHPYVTFASAGTLTTRRLDSLLPAQARFDLLAIDTQGAELRVLKGLGERLASVRWACIEINTRPLYEGAATLRQVDDFLGTRGFVRVARKMADAHGWGDAIYLRVAGLSRWTLWQLRLRARLWHAFMRYRVPHKVPPWDNWRATPSG